MKTKLLRKARKRFTWVYTGIDSWDRAYFGNKLTVFPDQWTLIDHKTKEVSFKLTLSSVINEMYCKIYITGIHNLLISSIFMTLRWERKRVKQQHALYIKTLNSLKDEKSISH